MHQFTGIALTHTSLVRYDFVPAFTGFLGEQTMMYEAVKKKITEMKFGEKKVTILSDQEYELFFIMVTENIPDKEIKGDLSDIQNLFKKKYPADVLKNFDGDIRRFMPFEEEIKAIYLKKSPVEEIRGQTSEEFKEGSNLPESESQFIRVITNLARKRIKKTAVSIKNDHIYELDLSNLGLKKLPESIGNLIHLTTLNLLDNKISELPASFLELENLENLNLNNNRFTSLPGQIGLLKNLKNLAGISNPWDNESKGIFNNSVPVIKEFCRKKASLFIFLSHAEDDFYSKRIKVKKISEILEEKPEIYKAYYSEEDLQGNFDRFMRTHVPKCQILIFFATPKSLNSKPCKLELQLALDNNLEIIPILGPGVTWENLRTIPLKDKMGNMFSLSGEKGIQYQKKIPIFVNNLYDHVYKLKRNINLFDEVQGSIDKFRIKFTDEINSYLKSDDYKDRLKSNRDKIMESFKGYQNRSMGRVEYFENIFKIVRNGD